MRRVESENLRLKEGLRELEHLELLKGESNVIKSRNQELESELRLVKKEKVDLQVGIFQSCPVCFLLFFIQMARLSSACARSSSDI